MNIRAKQNFKKLAVIKGLPDGLGVPVLGSQAARRLSSVACTLLTLLTWGRGHLIADAYVEETDVGTLEKHLWKVAGFSSTIL